MSLLKTAESNATFESDDVVTSTKTSAESATAMVAAPTSAPAVAATQSPAAVALTQARDAFDQFRNALPVEYNTLDQIIASNGNFVERETKTVLGDTVHFDLLSFQDSFVVSPEDDNAPGEIVRYSNDGVVCSDGSDVKEHLDWLHQNGYPKARLKQRVVVVGAVTSAAKTDKFNGQLVQFDLSPASRTLWQRFAISAAYGLTTGRVTAAQVSKVKAEALLKSRGNDTYTVASFSTAG
jgi:hypothetical protein